MQAFPYNYPFWKANFHILLSSIETSKLSIHGVQVHSHSGSSSLLYVPCLLQLPSPQCLINAWTGSDMDHVLCGALMTGISRFQYTRSPKTALLWHFCHTVTMKILKQRHSLHLNIQDSLLVVKLGRMSYSLCSRVQKPSKITASHKEVLSSLSKIKVETDPLLCLRFLSRKRNQTAGPSVGW